MVIQGEPTAERLVTAAMTLFQQKGYGSTSIADILREAGANAGSLYHVFPTKQDLLLAVLRRYREGIAPMLLEPAWAGVDDPIARVFALLERYRLALELHEPDPPVREWLAANFDGWTDAIRECLHQAGDRLPPGIDREGLAQFVLAVMEGGVMQARTHRTLAPFDASVAALRDYFNRLTSQA